MDTNGDGLITHSEFASFFSRDTMEGVRRNNPGDGTTGDDVDDDDAHGDDDADELGVIWLQLRGIDSEFSSEDERSHWLEELQMTMTPLVCANTESFADAIEQVRRNPYGRFIHCSIAHSLSPYPTFTSPIPFPFPSLPPLPQSLYSYLSSLLIQ